MVMFHDKIQLQDMRVCFLVLAGVHGVASGSNGAATTSIVSFCARLLHQLGDYFNQLRFSGVNHNGLLQSCSFSSLVRLNKQQGLRGTYSCVNSVVASLNCGAVAFGGELSIYLGCGVLVPT